MNAPEYINDAHEALLRADDALSVTDVAREIHGTTKPNKTQIKAAERQLKELNGLGLIAPEFRTGGVAFYRLIVAPAVQVGGTGVADIAQPAECVAASGDSEGGETDAPLNFAASPELQYLAPEDYEMPPADPVWLAKANRAISEQLDEFRAQLSIIAETVAPYLPDPSDISTARAVEILDMLAEAQTGHILAQESALETRIQAWVKERGDISHVLEEIVFEPFTTSLLDHAKTAANAFSALSAKHETLKHQITELRTRAAEQAAQYQADIARISSGLAAERQAMNNAINEADRLRRFGKEAAAESQHAGPVRLTDDEIETIKRRAKNSDERKGVKGQLTDGRAIEIATLRANGFQVEN